MINRFKDLLKKAVKKTDDIVVNMDGGVGGSWEVKNSDIECAIDEEIVPCDTLEDVFFSPEAQGSWTGIPAPAYLEDDPWFGSAPTLTEKQEEFKAESDAFKAEALKYYGCLLYTSPSPRDLSTSRMPSSA